MDQRVKAVVFDWGRTLYDPDQGALFPGVVELARRLSERYRLAIVSLITDEAYHVRLNERLAVLRLHGLDRYFTAILFAPAEKDALYVEVLAQLGLSPREVAIVDDRVARGIRWGNRHGAVTIWLRRGRFAAEAPDADTGPPTYVIETIAAVGNLL